MTVLLSVLDGRLNISSKWIFQPNYGNKSETDLVLIEGLLELSSIILKICFPVLNVHH